MKKRNIASCILMLLMILFAAFVLFPILIVFINSFKGRLFISSEPFTIPKGDAFVGMTNYTEGLAKTGFFSAFGYSLWITVASVLIILLFTSMLAWYITRVKGVITQIIYYALVFSMIVPFQMVMFTMSKIANMLSLDNPVGIIVLYVGFGAGMASFMFSGFIKSIDRRSKSCDDILPGRASDAEKHSRHDCYSQYHVDMERLSDAVSHNRYKLQDNPCRDTVPQGRLWCG